MSYILDALRRAEAERERGQVPGLHAHGLGPAAAPSGSRGGRGGRWAPIAVAGLSVAVVLLAWRPWAVGDAPPAVATVRPPPPAAAGRGARSAGPPPARVDEPKVRRRVAVAASAPVGVAAPTRPPTPVDAVSEEGKVYAVAALPEDVRRALPPVTIGGSSDSPDPARRFVIVGGQLFREGDTLAPGLVLRQIRLKSAVLSFRGYRYSVTF